MAPLQPQHHHCTKVVMLVYLLLLLFVNSASAAHSHGRPRRILLNSADPDHSVNNKPTSTIATANISSKNKTKFSKATSSNSYKNPTNLTQPSSASTKNQTKLIQPSPASSKNQSKVVKPSSTSTKNQTKLTKPSPSSFKNQTKLIKATTGAKNQTKHVGSTTLDPAKNKNKLTKHTSDSKHDSSEKSQIKKFRSSSNSTTKISSTSPKKPTDLPKLTPPKNKTTKETKSELKTSANKPKPNSPVNAHARSQKPPNQIDQEDEDDDDDLISEFRDLPYKFHETLVPDLAKFSKTSRIYLTNYNLGITEGFKPYVGNKHAPTVASIASFAFIIIPLILVSLIFNRITAYIPLQRILIFIQFYLAMYFAILGLSSVVTGIEPLKFFYSASPTLYVGVQILKTVAYGLYLMLVLMYLVTAFLSKTGLGAKLLSLVQAFVGFAIGLHYYVAVFHRALRHQPPKVSWKIHALYATCFLVICLLGTAGRRKKAYLEEGGEEGKKS